MADFSTDIIFSTLQPAHFHISTFIFFVPGNGIATRLHCVTLVPHLLLISNIHNTAPVLFVTALTSHKYPDITISVSHSTANVEVIVTNRRYHVY